MHSLTLSLAALALLAGRAAAQEKQPIRLPSGPAPTFVVLTAVNPKAGTVDFHHQVTSQFPTQVAKKVIRNGVPVDIIETVYITQTHLETRRLVLKALAITDGAGKNVTPTQALERLRPGSVIVQSADSRPVDPAYLRALRPETLVFAPAATKGTVPVPAPSK